MSVLDRLPDAVIELDAAGTITGCNAVAVEFLGSAAALVGQPAATVLEPRDAHRRPMELETLVTATRAVECTVHRVGTDGSPAGDVSLSVTAKAHDDGTIVLCARPVSDHSGIAVVSTVSHELRSPLTSVKGYVSLLLNRWDRIDDDAKREMLAQVNHDADRVTRLIGELLDISRIEAGRLTLRRQNVDLVSLAEQVIAKVSLAYGELRAVVDFVDVPEVYADPDKIEQVLTNLVENGAKYGNPTGIEVRGHVVDDVVTVEVTDHGDGIPEQDIPRLFDKFFRRDHGRPDGTGLGLWISRGLVEAHGGELSVDSEVGSYATFRFTLPTRAFELAHPTA